ncbi:hypothetical protein LINGRAHAP2_LOCUS35837 [Linum grandiflorum]
MERCEDILNNNGRSQQQLYRDQEAAAAGSNKKEEQVEVKLPMESSPYTGYSNVEEYKLRGYGAQGHQSVNPNQAHTSTDAPTLSGTKSQSSS